MRRKRHRTFMFVNTFECVVRVHTAAKLMTNSRLRYRVLNSLRMAMIN